MIVPQRTRAAAAIVPPLAQCGNPRNRAQAKRDNAGLLASPGIVCTTPTHPHSLTRLADLPTTSSHYSPHSSSYNLASPYLPPQIGGKCVILFRHTLKWFTQSDIQSSNKLISQSSNQSHELANACNASGLVT
jgi:hypothetical protein